jgi:zinc/manganese transport system permease protein
MFQEPYMQNAFVTGTVVAVTASVVGFFVVLRGLSFAAHSLAQIGFAGAAGAVLLGVDPLLGLVAFAVAGAVSMGMLSTEEHGRDVTTALILVFALGTGALFLTLNNAFATAAFSLLFGSIVGISRDMVWQTIVLSVACVVSLAILYRPLLLATVNADLARARGVPVSGVGIAFLIVVAVAAAVTVPTVGTLLIFSLMIGPAASAMYLAGTPWRAMIMAIALSVAATWIGIIAAYDSGAPVGFLISATVSAVYFGARLVAPARRGRQGLHAKSRAGELLPQGNG